MEKKNRLQFRSKVIRRDVEFHPRGKHLLVRQDELMRMWVDLCMGLCMDVHRVHKVKTCT